MKAITLKSMWQSIGIGIIAGMRSVSAPALTSHLLRKNRSDQANNAIMKFMTSNGLATTLNVFAVGELIADKLPSAPSRTMPAGLVARLITGGLSAAAIAKAGGNNAVIGALIGTAAALGSTFAFYNLRRATGKKTGIADPITALIEDSLVVCTSLALIKTARPG